MTRQQIEALAAETLGYLSRCTPTAIERLTVFHSGTIQILRWYRQGFLLPTSKMEEQFRKLIRNIIDLAANPAIVRKSTEQPTLDWMETPL